MIQNILTIALILVLLNFFCGCHTTSTVRMTKENIPSLAAKDKVTRAVLNDGSLIVYRPEGGQYMEIYNDRTNVLIGYTTHDSLTVVGMDEILEITVEKQEENVGGTVLMIIGVTALMFGIILAVAIATKQSCPFVYSYDGTRYVFDGEPYGGAITAGLQKTDYSRLENLAPVNGTYRLLLRNEADESQHTDEMKLLVYDHPVGTTIAPDYAGTMTAFTTTQAPVTATNGLGTSLTKFFATLDGVCWQSRMPQDSSFVGTDTRDHLVFKFLKPKGKKSVRFLVNAGTASWGSNMIKEMLKLRGDKVEEWYRNIDQSGSELLKLHSFIEREELFLLKVYVLEGLTWNQRGSISAGGPLINEDRVITVDLQAHHEDTLVIKLNPPIGYWKIDYLGLIADEVSTLKGQELSPALAEDQDGRDLIPLLQSIDRQYYFMPEVGNWSRVEYTAPVPISGSKRTVYLKTTGYYDIHLPKDAPEQTQLIQELSEKPGKIVEYSLQQFLRWRAEQMSMN